MTVRLLVPYGKYPKNTLLTTGAAEEARLLREGLADTNTGAGTAYVAPVATEISSPPSVETTGAAEVLKADGRAVLDLAATRALVSGDGNGAWNVETAALTPAQVAASIQSALDSADTTQVYVDFAGTLVSEPIYIPPGKTLVVGRSSKTVLKRADGVNAPLIRNRYGGQLNKANRFNRAANVVTVNNRFHGLRVGDTVWVANLTDASMNGLQTVASVPDQHSWTYASAGANGAGGTASVFGFIIPIRRTFAGAAFVSAANLVTVADPGHDLRVGMKVWLGTTGASTAFCGIVEVTDVSADTWTYLTSASGTGAAVGTIALSYDADITLTGEGRIDGNPLNNATLQDVDLMLSAMSFGMLNNGLVNVKAITGTIFRCLNFFNPTNTVVERTEFGDTLVAVQLEGGAKGCEVRNVRGSTGKWITGTRTADDAVAFTGTKIVGGQLYDSTASPYGLDGFYGNKVSGLYMPNCLNGVKQTGDATVTFDQQTYEDINTGMTSNTLGPLGNSTAAVRMVDDTAGLQGMVCGSIFIRRVRAFGGASAVVWSSKGTAKLIDIDGVQHSPNALQSLANTNAAVNVAGTAGGGGAIKRLRVRGITHVSPGASKPCLVLGSGDVAATDAISIEEFVLEAFDFTPWVNASGAAIVKYGNCTVGTAKLSDGKFRGSGTAGTGYAIALRGANLAGKWLLDNVTGVAGANALGVLVSFIPSDNTTAAVDVTLRNCNIACTSLVFDNSQVTTGTFTLRIQGGTVTPSSKLFNCASSTAALALLADPTAVLPAITSGLITAAGTLRLSGSALQADGALVTAPVAGDALYNTNAAFGAPGVGAYVRGSAAWTRVAA